MEDFPTHLECNSRVSEVCRGRAKGMRFAFFLVGTHATYLAMILLLRLIRNIKKAVVHLLLAE
jgi:hypothetical protein